jgi:hypothetical protein
MITKNKPRSHKLRLLIASTVFATFASGAFGQTMTLQNNQLQIAGAVAPPSRIRRLPFRRLG